jgi:aspartyl-tRNA(Asn)/glutamyl-tRNA(Gln) amidotransferase subunit A
MLQAIAGYDEADPTTADKPVPDYTRATTMPVAKLRLGIPRTPFFDQLDPDVAGAVEAAIDVLRKLTLSVGDIQIPTAVNPAEIWNTEIYTYHSKWIAATPQLYQPATRAAILKDGEEKAEVYAQARWTMQLQRREIAKVFSNVDLLITPTMADPAPLIAPPAGSPVSRRGLNTSPFDVFGLPTISVPCGFSKSGLPIGLQISGAPFAESTVLALAYRYEQATEWHKRHPPLAG